MEFLLLMNYLVAFFTLFITNVFLLLFFKHRDIYLASPKKSSRQPLVSVVIAAYNEEDYIGRCLDSLLAMDYPQDKLDIILVDDGSTDRTLVISKTYEKKGVRIYTKKNQGKSSALNYGIKKARGEFLATMDADSYVTKNTISELLGHFEDPMVMAATPAIKIAQSKSWIREIQRVEYLMILFSRKLLTFLDSVPVTPGPFSMFRTRIFDEIGGFSETSLVEDMEIALRIQSRNYRIRSSLTAEVYTEPPDNISDLLKQRVRWQRGGFRNYWEYRRLMVPEYGDFGVYFIPLNWFSLFSLFIIFGLMVHSLVSTPYYVQYIWVDSVGMGISLFTFVTMFVVLAGLLFLYLSVKSFRNETVRLRYLIAFMLSYWYLMLMYNVLFISKEMKREPASW